MGGLALRHRLNFAKPRVINPESILRPWIILVTIIVSTIVAVISSFTVMIASSSIQGALTISDTENMWVSLIFLLTVAVSVPIANWFSERQGYKKLFVIGLTLFFLSTLFCGLTSSYTVMLLCRVFAGMGAGIIFPNSLTLLSLVFSQKKRTFAIAIYVAGSFGLGTILGVFLGGYLTEFHSWRSIFTSLVPLAPFLLLSVWMFFPETEKKRNGPFDYLGTLFYLTFIWSFVVWLANVKASWNTDGFSSTFSQVTLTVGICALIAFVIWDRKVKYPLFKLSLFKVRPFTLGGLAVFAVGSTFFSTTGNISSIFENELFYSQYRAGLFQIPFGAMIGFFGALSGLLSEKVGIRTLALLGMAITAVSCFMSYMITIQSGHTQYFWLQIIRGTGIGLSLGPLTALALKRIQPEDLGQAAVLVTLFRQLGASIGSIFTDLMQGLRVPFHLLRFGEQMSLNSPELIKHMENVEDLLTTQAGSIPTLASVGPTGFFEEASVRSYHELVNYASAQAKILSINDAYWIIGWVLTTFFVVIGFFIVRAKIKERFGAC